MEIAEQIDREDAHRLLRGLDQPLDVDDRREAHAFAPQRPQSEEHALVERTGIADDLMIGASGDRVDRFAERTQRALIGELNGHHHRDADGDAEDGQCGARFLTQQRTED